MFNKKPFIKFINITSDLDDCKPIPSKKALPAWWRDIPLTHNGVPTIKNCPSFPDYFASGYIVPMWMDITATPQESDSFLFSNRFAPFPAWDVHPKEQFVDHVPAYVGNRKVTHTLKINCPWHVITSPGYSVMQIPLFYEFNRDWTVLPGIIDTDIHHQVNQQLLIHSDLNPIEFKKNQPFVMYVPFKRQDYNFESRNSTEEDIVYFEKKEEELQKFRNAGHSYRKLQRNRDS